MRYVELVNYTQFHLFYFCFLINFGWTVWIVWIHIYVLATLFFSICSDKFYLHALYVFWNKCKWGCWLFVHTNRKISRCKSLSICYMCHIWLLYFWLHVAPQLIYSCVISMVIKKRMQILYHGDKQPKWESERERHRRDKKKQSRIMGSQITL